MRIDTIRRIVIRRNNVLLVVAGLLGMAVTWTVTRLFGTAPVSSAAEALLAGLCVILVLKLRTLRSQSQEDQATIAQLTRALESRMSEFRILLEVLPIGIAVAEDPECRRIWINSAHAGMLQVPLGQNISKSGKDAD